MQSSIKWHIEARRFDAYTQRIQKIFEAQKVTRARRVDNILNRISGSNSATDTKNTLIVPQDAIITLRFDKWVKKIISQEWLAKQPPPPAFREAGGEVYDEENPYNARMRNPDKMQAWLVKGVWYHNKKAEDWMMTQIGWKVLTQSDLRKLYEQNKWNNNADTMKKMWIAPVGWFCALNAKVWDDGDGVLRSSSRHGDGFMRVLWLDPHVGKALDCWIWRVDGSVPFASMD